MELMYAGRAVRDAGVGVEGGWSNDGPEPSDGLRLSGVSVRRSGKAAAILSEVDLVASAGSVVAVVGRAGSGKVCT